MVQRKPALTPARQPICSVCVANYNGHDTLDACLRSILEQACDFEVEIILHDDASTDGSADRLQERFPGVELLLSAENVGYCVSNNRMVEAARGEFILLLNNDAELLPDALRLLLQRARARPGVILGLPQYALPDGRFLDCGSLLDPFLNPLPNLDLAYGDVGMVMGACLWISKARWIELGGFPAWFRTNAEDLYLCCRARLAGYAVEVLPHSGFRHWVGRSQGGGKVENQSLRSTFRRRACSERNKTFTMLVCYPATAIAILVPLHVLLLAAEGVVLTLLRRDPAIWTEIYAYALVECWQERANLWRARREAQAQRRVTLRQFFATHVAWPYKLRLLWRYGVPRIER